MEMSLLTFICSSGLENDGYDMLAFENCFSLAKFCIITLAVHGFEPFDLFAF